MGIELLSAGLGKAAGGGGFGGKKQIPAPPDYTGLANQQAQVGRENVDRQTTQNRPNQSTPYASTQWGVGPDGRPTQQVGFNGPLAGANTALQEQFASNMAKPFSLSHLPSVGTGDEARQQASNAAYQQAASRLDPQWQQRESQNRSRLLNQGLTEGTAAWDRAMSNLSRDRNDAYNQANFSAIREGTAAGDSVFRNNLAARQQGVGEYSMERNAPMQGMAFMQQLLGMPGFSQAGQAPTPNLVGAAGMQDAAAMQRYQMQQQQMMDLINGLAQIGGTVGMAASDERVKVDVVRTKDELLPGVPLATWRYKPGMGYPEGKWRGVVAQDLQRVSPQHVRERDGVLYVTAPFLPEYVND
jgi:hypothetical protein